LPLTLYAPLAKYFVTRRTKMDIPIEIEHGEVKFTVSKTESTLFFLSVSIYEKPSIKGKFLLKDKPLFWCEGYTEGTINGGVDGGVVDWHFRSNCNHPHTSNEVRAKIGISHYLFERCHLTKGEGEFVLWCKFYNWKMKRVYYRQW